ncbi:MAG TPA: protease inhibitor I42 family protein [Candidatus Tripitaka californicus]|uniref:protease inhibitor I42 family protein n=1 Tax=Candidatus Tripitaka californicus TaxID=3367616 RepID=UPI004028F665|nr:protease inhibitor I42 family protein [Planctomycetota bacterium]
MNSKRLILLTVCITSMVLSHSCTKQVREYGEPDNAIEVKAGKDFIITLESNRTTGYGWQLARPLDGAVLELVGSEYTPGESKLIGSGGREIWTFRAVGAGKTPIAFKYIRPWEKDVPPAREASFTVAVSPRTSQ